MKKSIIATIFEGGGGFLTSPDTVLKGLHYLDIAANLSF